MPNKPTDGFSAEEKAAMKERARELKAAARKSATDAEGEADVLAKIAELPEPDREMAMRVHTLIKSAVPTLSPRTWYGMPSYAKDDKVICFFQSAQKFKTRYSTLGFSDKANLDDGAIWPTSYALLELTPEVETKITELVKKAAG